jgi:hypothetical protein
MLKKARPEVLGVFLLAATQILFANPEIVTSGQADAATHAKATALYAHLPLAFEVNEGQTNPQVKALSRGSGYGLFLTSDESVLVLTSKSGKTAAIRTKILGGQTARIVPGGKLAGTVNSFIGNDRAKWHTNVPTYSRMRYEGVYPGVDLVYYGNNQQLEYDYIVAPGADPNAIRFSIRGAKARIDANGDLVLHTGVGDVRQHKPVIYQEIAGRRREVAGHFVKLAKNELGFAVADYDREQSLVIDPTLVFSTYLGGTGSDQAFTVAVDALGDTLIAGTTTSLNYPTDGNEPGPYPTYTGATSDAFFSVIFFQQNADSEYGSILFISSYYGGTTGTTSINAISLLQGSGQLIPSVFIAGTTSAKDLPTVNPLQSGGYGGGASDAFVAQLKYPQYLEYSSYLGGSGADSATSLTHDSYGNIIVAGSTTSTNFPVTNAIQSTNEGGTDGFVAKYNTTWTQTMFSTYLGGSGNDTINAIADAKNDALILVGSTTSTGFGAPNTASGGYPEAFLTSLSTTGTAGPMVLRIFGGKGESAATGVATFNGSATCTPEVPASIWVTGFTTSATGFPIKNAIQHASAGGADAWVQVYQAGLLTFSSYFGGAGTDEAKGVAIDGCGNGFIAGFTNSTNFPVTNALQTSNAGGYDGFVVNFKYGPGGIPTVNYSTYLGGSGTDIITSISVPKGGNATVVGYTTSSNFPTTTGVIQPTYAGDTDAFATKIDTQ